ncbi:MAG: cysteine protease [Prevotella sp.]|nr:cysteine protease [Prevotella sp.]
MRRTFLYAACMLLVMACGKKEQTPTTETAKHFTTEVLLKTTPVKSQGKSDLCWAYAMLATIETEHLMQGDSVNLSPDYVAYMFLREQAGNRYMRSNEPLVTRGMITMLPTLIYRYGCEPYDTFHAEKGADYRALTKVLTTVTDSHRQQRSGFERMMKDVDSRIEEVLGIAPQYVFMYSCEYTPHEFAHSVCRQDEYTALTSFTHHPFGQRFELEVPDNRHHDTFLNLPIDTLQAVVDSTLRAGHPVCWEGDTSEHGFNFSRGTANLDDENEPVTQRKRQALFERFQTTDDHCMEIIGIAHDDQGKKYYICKNSWGRVNPYHGWMFMSEPYFRLKTIAVMVHH